MKTAAKKALKLSTLVAPVAAPVTVPDSLIKATQAYVDACDGVASANTSMLTTLKVIMNTSPLNDAQVMLLYLGKGGTLDSMCGESRKAAASYARKIVNNAIKVAYGAAGTKNKPAVKGKGIAAVRAVCEKATGLNVLADLMCKAKPEALKSAQGGDRTDKAPKAAPVKAAPVNVFELPSDKAGIFQKMQSILDFVLSVCDAGTDEKIINAAKALEQEITNGEFRARMPAKKKVA
jgi:hypothetical protein